MTGRPLRRLSSLPRALYGGVRARSRAREESRFQPGVQFDAGEPELLLSPHWDDAALSCWSLLESDRALNVVNVFGGLPPALAPGPWEAVLGVNDAEQRARLRMSEDRRALAAAGRGVVNLPLLDAQYRRRTAAAASIEMIDRALRAEVPGASRVYVPAAIGSHVDHLLTRRYGRLLLRSGMPVTLFAELPYCALHGWPPWVDGQEPAAGRDVDAYWLSSLREVAELPPLEGAQVLRLEGPAAAAKREAVASYQASLSFGMRALMADPAFHGFEVRWELIR
jgi:hypothetical protein